MNVAVTTRPGWEARLELEYGLRGTKTRLINKRQLGPLTVQRPFYPEGDTCHSYILHPPGGVVGGDSLRIDIKAGAGAHCLLTTPGATKFYRTTAQRLASQSQHIVVADDGVTEWLPQQNIFFPGANVALSTCIDIAAGGRFIGWEMNCLGRPANGEKFSVGSVRSRTQVRIAGELRLAEQLTVCDEQALVAATGMRGLAVQASLIAAPCTTAHSDALEQLLQASPALEYPHPIGVTVVDDVLVVRALGDQTEPLLQIFTLLWTQLRGHWLAMPPCVPRIWAT